MKGRERNLPIQALRALAAGLVLIYHANWLNGGYIGVDIFYVISGFLITGLLLRELEDKRSLSLTAFYARRTKRLLPASFLVITVTGVVGFLILPASMREEFGKDLIAASTYISNFLFALWQNDYQNLNSTPSPFIHFWSLAVEEQFYLFWPLFLFILYKVGQRRAVFIGVVAIFLSSFAFSLYLTQVAPIWSFYILPTRAWELAAGAILVFLPMSHRKRSIRTLLAILSIVSIVSLAIVAFLFNENTPFPGTAALVPVLATAMLIHVRDNLPPILEKVAKLRAVQWMGEISYPLYLWHWPILVIPAIYLGRELNTLEKLALLSATVALAGVTHKFVEEPMRYLNWSSLRIFKSAAAVTFLCLVIGSATIFSYSNSLTVGKGVTLSLDQIRSKPKNVEDGCHIHIRQTVSPRCEYGDTSSSKTIILYGDSHAAQWLPALDKIGKKQGIKIVSLTKSACPSAEVIKELSSQYAVKDCQAFRDSSINRIQTTRPLAVIMTGMQPFTAPNSTKSSRSWWLAGEAKAYERIKNYTKFPIYLTDTPLPQIDIPDCLAADRGKECDTSRKIDPEVARGLIAIDPTPWLCGSTCPAIVDGIVAYRDRSHLTVAMSEHLSYQLAVSLARIGLF